MAEVGTEAVNETTRTENIGLFQFLLNSVFQSKEQPMHRLDESASVSIETAMVEEPIDTAQKMAVDIVVEDDESDKDNAGSQTEKDSDMKDESGDTKDDGRDDGVPDEVWAELELAKETERQRLDDLRRQQVAYEQFLRELEAKEQEARRKHEEELERIRKELEHEERERALREAFEAEQRRKQQEEMDRKLREQEEPRRLEELRHKEEIQRRLQRINPCPMGFSWFRQGSGWRCGGGSHFVLDEELRKRFMTDL
jgi:hypothetical protein